jgi:GNAT superfamily N-acetyltransferase
MADTRYSDAYHGRVSSAEIRVCEEADLDLLDRCMPSGGRTSFHRRRLERQKAGAGTYLVAWLHGRPVGHLLIRWTGCEADDVRRSTGGCPELNALGVWPPELRRRGIGRDLLRRAEVLVAERGHPTVGLGVADGNPDAARLYRRLGYTTPAGRYVGRWTWIDHHGDEREESEQSTFFVKNLAGERAAGGRAD